MKIYSYKNENIVEESDLIEALDIDLKKDKYDEDGKRTVFVFKNDDGLEEIIKRFSTKR